MCRLMLPLLVALQMANHPVGVGDRAPQQPMIDLDGATVELGHQRAVVTFCATWCSPCHEAIADLLLARQRSVPFMLVLVVVGETASQARSFVKDRGIPRDVAVVLGGEALARVWGEDRLPTTFLVDQAGILRHINRGYGSGFRSRVEGWLSRMP